MAVPRRIGMGMLLLSFLLVLVVSLPLVNLPKYSFVRLPSLTLPSSSVGYTVIALNASTPLNYDIENLPGYIITYDTTGPSVDFYLLNSTAFSIAGSYIRNNQSLRSVADDLESSGALQISFDSSAGAFPHSNNSVYSVVFSRQLSSLPAGTYYAVYQSDDSYDTAGVETVIQYYPGGFSIYGLQGSSAIEFFVVMIMMVLLLGALGSALYLTAGWARNRGKPPRYGSLPRLAGRYLEWNRPFSIRNLGPAAA